MKRSDLRKNLDDFFTFRRSIFLVLLVVASLLTIPFYNHIVSGAAWMTGTQNLGVLDQRFGPANNVSPNDLDGEEKFWVKQDYSDEIEGLSEKEYYVTQENGTETPFQNEYYDNNRPGIYIDVVSGAPLFSSKHKFDSGTGWPSFYKPLEPQNIIERRDPGPLGVRTEIASAHAKSHLGHLFRNPETPTGLRYCMNSAALDFIPADKLEEEGYGQYADMFNSTG